MSTSFVKLEALCDSLKAIAGTYAQLAQVAIDNKLETGRAYILTDYEARYFDPVTGTYTVKAIEVLILRAVSTNSFGIVAQSAVNNTDYIEFDFSVNSVTDGVTTEPANGLITLRKDVDQNECGFDFRNITFDGAFIFTSIGQGNKVPWNEGLANGVGVHLPNSILGVSDNNSFFVLASSNIGEAFFNQGNLVAFSDIDVMEYNNNNTITASEVSRIKNSNNNEINASDVVSMENSNNNEINASDVVSMQSATNCNITSTNNVNLLSCSNLTIVNCTITNVQDFVRCGSPDGVGAFNFCEIVGLSPISSFRFNSLDTNITGASGTPFVIAESAHPLLFSTTPCKITRREDGTFGYTYINNSGVTVFVAF